MIRKYFPNLELENGLVHTLEARTKFAADLEQAMNRTTSQALKTSVPQRPKTPEGLTGPGCTTVFAGTDASQGGVPITPTQYLLYTLAILAGLGVLAFVIKRKSE